MKRNLIVFCLMLSMVLWASCEAFAAPSGFTVSPSGNAAPEVIGFTPDNKDCTSGLTVTAFVDKGTLDPAEEALLDAAYEKITSAKKITDLNKDLADAVAEKKLDANKLAVSDLFDLTCEGCTDHNEHHGFSIVLDAETLKNFVGLLQVDKNGNLQFISNASIKQNSQQVDFWVDYLSPIAIVVQAGSTDTGDTSSIYFWLILMLASTAGVVYLAVPKKRANTAK